MRWHRQVSHDWKQQPNVHSKSLDRTEAALLWIKSGEWLCNGESSDSAVPTPQWTDCAKQRWKAYCLSRHDCSHGVLVDASIRNTEVERQSWIHVSWSQSGNELEKLKNAKSNIQRNQRICWRMEHRWRPWFNSRVQIEYLQRWCSRFRCLFLHDTSPPCARRRCWGESSTLRWDHTPSRVSFKYHSYSDGIQSSVLMQ